MIKKILNTIAWTTLWIVLFVSTWLLAALLLPLFTVNSKPLPGTDVTIYISTNGDHTDIIVPVVNKIKDWRSEISYKNTISQDTINKYVAVGWGDKGFYLNTPTWSQLKFSVAFKAAFALSTTALHTTFCDNLKESADCKKITLNYEQYSRLIKYIDDSFKRAQQGQVVNISTTANYNKEDAFYEAKGKYNLFFTCNTWANGALKSCGQKAALWTVSDIGIFYHYR